MAKVYERVTKTETRTYEHLVRRTCDLCGKPSKGYGSDWKGANYEVDETEIEVTIRQKEGYNWPEGGSGTNYDIDLCPTCFLGKLVPWLRSQGATIEAENWDW